MQKSSETLMCVASGCSGSGIRGVQSHARGYMNGPKPGRRDLKLQWWGCCLIDAMILAFDDHHVPGKILEIVLLSRLQGQALYFASTYHLPAVPEPDCVQCIWPDCFHYDPVEATPKLCNCESIGSVAPKHEVRYRAERHAGMWTCIVDLPAGLAPDYGKYRPFRPRTKSLIISETLNHTTHSAYHHRSETNIRHQTATECVELVVAPISGDHYSELACGIELTLVRCISRPCRIRLLSLTCAWTRQSVCQFVGPRTMDF